MRVTCRSMEMCGLGLVELTVVASLIGCGEPGRTRAVVRDSAGVAIVENAQADSAALNWWLISATAEVDIGAAEGGESETLFRVTDTKRLSDGRLVVANSGAAQIRYYGADGQLDTIVGKSGGGPGEFQRITQLIVLPGDSVVVHDPAARRMTMLDARGGFVRNFGGDGALATILGAAPAGGWIGSLRNQGEPSMTGGNVRQDLLYAFASSDGNSVTDTIGRFAGNERHVRVTRSGGQISSINIFAPPFARTTTVRLQGDALIVGTQDAPELRVYGIDGELRRIIRTGAGQTPITKDHIDRFIERSVAGLAEDQANSVRQSMATLPSPNFLPSYGTFLIDRSGNLWLQDYPGLQDAQRWSVFDPEGGLLARVALPDRFTPYDIGADWIAGKELDELDVEHARVYRLTRSR